MKLEEVWRRGFFRSSSSPATQQQQQPKRRDDEKRSLACKLCELPDSVLDQMFYFLVDEKDVASLSCCGRVLNERGSDPGVLSEVARLGFTIGRGGLELSTHDCLGASVSSARFKRARHVESWPTTLTTRRAHSDVTISNVADGLVEVSCNVRCKARSNRCVAGDLPFSILHEAPVPGVRQDGRKLWRLASGAYFEVTLKTTRHSKSIDSRKNSSPSDAAILSSSRPCVAIGLCTSSFSLKGKQPGWDHSSWAVHADDGLRFHGRGVGAPYGPAFVAGDVVGCGVFKDHDDNSAFVFYTLNGVLVDDKTRAFTLSPKVTRGLYPVIGMDTNRIACEVNFGISKPFQFDLDDFLTSLAPPEQQRQRHRADSLAGMVAHSSSSKGKSNVTTMMTRRLSRTASRPPLRSRFALPDFASFVARAEQIFYLDFEQQQQQHHHQRHDDDEEEEEEVDDYYEEEEEEEEEDDGEDD